MLAGTTVRSARSGASSPSSSCGEPCRGQPGRDLAPMDASAAMTPTDPGRTSAARHAATTSRGDVRGTYDIQQPGVVADR